MGQEAGGLVVGAQPVSGTRHRVRGQGVGLFRGAQSGQRDGHRRRRAQGDRVVRAERVPGAFPGVLTQGAALLGVTVLSVGERQRCAGEQGGEMVGP